MKARITFAALMLLLSGAALSQSFVEINDRLRGVSFYSIALSDDSLTALQKKGSAFSEADRMTLGFSALLFDEAEDVEEYVLWIRHNGNDPWFTPNMGADVSISVDQELLQPRPGDPVQLHAPLVEQLELRLSPSDMKTLLEGDLVSINVQTLLGVIEKPLSKEELNKIEQLVQRVRIAAATQLPG